MRRFSSYALLIFCCLFFLAGCIGGSGSQPQGAPATTTSSAQPTRTVNPNATATPTVNPNATATPIPTPTPIPTQTPVPTATAVFPASCPGFRNTSRLQDDDLVDIYWHHSSARDRAIVEFVASANSVNPNNREQMGSLSQSQILAAARAFWEQSAEGRARCGDLAAVLVAAGVLRSDTLR